MSQEVEVMPKPKKPQPTTELPEPVQNLTLPQLMSVVTRRILTALESEDQNQRSGEVNACRKDFRLWYESQPVEGRKEVAKKVRKTLENFRSIGEQFTADMSVVTAQDI